jgi:lipopolysaccharide exporter
LDFRGMFYSYVMRNGFLFLSIALGYFNVYTISLERLAWAHLVGGVLGSVVSYLVIRDRLLLAYTIEWTWIKKIFHYGKYVVGTNLSSMLYSAADQFMLGSLVSTASVATYNAPGRITNLINVPSVTLTSVLFPRSAQVMATEGKEGVKVLYEKSVGAVVGVVLPAIVFVSVFPEWIITVIAGESYLDSVPILQVAVFVSLFMPFAYQFGTILDSIGKARINFYTTAISFVANASLNYYLISFYGIMGAVWGSLGIAALRFIVMQFILYRQIGSNPLNIPGYTLLFYSSLIRSFKGLVIKRQL